MAGYSHGTSMPVATFTPMNARDASSCGISATLSLNSKTHTTCQDHIDAGHHVFDKMLDVSSNKEGDASATFQVFSNDMVHGGQPKHDVNSLAMEDNDDVLTNVAGISLFLELYLDYVDDGIGNSVLTHVGDLSIFLEQPRDSLKDPEVMADTSIGLGHAASGAQKVYLILPPQEDNSSDLLTVPWDPCTPWDVTHDPIFLPPYATTSVKLSSPWDPGKQDMIFIGPNRYIRLVIVWAPMKWRRIIRADSLGQAGGGLVPCLHTSKSKNALMFYHWHTQLPSLMKSANVISAAIDFTKEYTIKHVIAAPTFLVTTECICDEKLRPPVLLLLNNHENNNMPCPCKCRNSCPFLGVSSDHEYK
jgi:hypothetical protein